MVGGGQSVEAGDDKRHFQLESMTFSHSFSFIRVLSLIENKKIHFLFVLPSQG